MTDGHFSALFCIPIILTVLHYAVLYLPALHLSTLSQGSTYPSVCLRVPSQSGSLGKLSQKKNLLLFGHCQNRFDALIATQKTSALCEVPFLKKSVKTAKKTTILSKMPIFLGISKKNQKWDFAES